jgi:hypothetical protein
MKSLLLRAAAILSPLFAAALILTPAKAAPFLVSYTGPTQTFVNISTAYTAHFESGGALIDHCRLSVDGASQGDMTLSGTGTLGDADASHSIAAAGSHTIRITCYNADESAEAYDEESVTVFADSAGPGVGTFFLDPTSVVAGTPVTIMTNYDDTDFGSGLASCGLLIDDAESGLMTLSGGVGSTAGNASIAYTFSAAGSPSVKINCFDRSGNLGTRTQTVSVVAPPDTTDPVVSAISPSSATVGVAVNIQATVSDDVGIASCELEVNGVSQGGMTVASGLATKALSFTIVGNNAIEVTCLDAAGNSGIRSALINVAEATTVTPSPYVNRLVKLTCPAGAVDVNHPCKAVYYVGSDGKRHAFPNERVYFTWYSNFDGIVELNGSMLATITLGSNVNYRPGMRMVKFTTVNRVYAVARYGSLRWVTSEAAATALYGSAWNTRIDDINDAFFTDYTFGADINSSADFNPTVEAATVANIDANLR